ncbi:hypothetical protein DICPUDRAFT_83577 [Dictyostelium purpureum]|uniref:RING-type domain-containing protein n=1 Tax=Dictyostelium purpureum TaxID=5786 RepID=F0ZZY3_DICPU|nr:uncharacterized protein DICPUDRAFT_83577 [Dictyostelium purpureum]EGC30498.1 hypothetical protein DICPUDRAFT_83577 [Dictyostelium purpureum]|eukprot:XP_003292971.1 hypothetical protein DICPUDRAFT_83577 [Dictyostelium purpureum]
MFYCIAMKLYKISEVHYIKKKMVSAPSASLSASVSAFVSTPSASASVSASSAPSSSLSAPSASGSVLFAPASSASYTYAPSASASASVPSVSSVPASSVSASVSASSASASTYAPPASTSSPSASVSAPSPLSRTNKFRKPVSINSSASTSTGNSPMKKRPLELDNVIICDREFSKKLKLEDEEKRIQKEKEEKEENQRSRLSSLQRQRERERSEIEERKRLENLQKELQKRLEQERLEKDRLERDDKCTICMNEIEASELAFIECVHRFCYECIFEWSKCFRTCPNCRKPFRDVRSNSFSFIIHTCSLFKVYNGVRLSLKSESFFLNIKRFAKYTLGFLSILSFSLSKYYRSQNKFWGSCLSFHKSEIKHWGSCLFFQIHYQQI